MSQFTDALKRNNTDPKFHDAYEDAVARERFLKTLIKMRTDANIRQEDVASAMGVGQSTVSQFENATDPRLSTVQRYARAVGAQAVFVATTRKLQSGEWRAPCGVQRARTSAWKGSSQASVSRAPERSAYAKAA